MKDILITGSNGFIGSHLAERLIDEGHRVFCMIRKTSDTTYLKGLNIEYTYCNFMIPDTLPSAVEGKDEIYHLGGVLRVANKERFYDVNSSGTRNLVNAVNKYNPDIKKFVYVSSQAAAGPVGKGPVSDYGKSKKMAENAVREIKNYVIVRPVPVYGPRDKDFLALFKMARSGIFLKPVQSGKLSFIHVKDCVEGIASTMPAEEKFLSDGNVYSWQEVANILKKVIKKRVHIIVLPVFLMKLGGAIGTTASKVTGKPVILNSDKVREMLADWGVNVNSKAGYSLYDGFLDTFDWYKKHGWL